MTLLVLPLTINRLMSDYEVTLVNDNSTFAPEPVKAIGLK